MDIEDIFREFSFGVKDNIRDKLLKMLKTEIDRSKRTIGAIIVTDEGLPIAYYPNDLFSDKSGFSPSLAIIENTVEKSIKELLDGDLDYITIATNNHILIIKNAGNGYIVSLISQKGVPMNVLYRKILRIIKRIEEIMK